MYSIKMYISTYPLFEFLYRLHVTNFYAACICSDICTRGLSQKKKKLKLEQRPITNKTGLPQRHCTCRDEGRKALST